MIIYYIVYYLKNNNYFLLIIKRHTYEYLLYSFVDFSKNYLNIIFYIFKRFGFYHKKKKKWTK